MTTTALIVGPERRTTGGVARFVAEQTDRLPGDVAVRTHDVGSRSATGARGVLLGLAVALWQMVAFAFRSRPDVVHVHSSHGVAFYRASFYVLFASYVWRRPVVLHEHGSSFDEFVLTASLPVHWLQSLVFGASSRVVVLSPYWRDVLSLRVPDEKLVVVPNAVDPSGYDPSFEPERPRVVFVSNHVPRKGIREFVESVETLSAEGHEFWVDIAGAGELSDAAEDLASAHDHVEYHGYVSEADKRDLLSSGSIYALPTYGEGLPIALLEAMAGGDAVVTTTVGAIPEVVGDDNGVLVEPGEVEPLTDALRELVTDPDRAADMGRRNRRLVLERYDWETASERLASIYRTLDDAEAPRADDDGATAKGEGQAEAKAEPEEPLAR